MTRCSVGRATQKYRGNGTDLSDILETPGDIIYADAAVSAENLVISGTTGDVLKVSASGIPEWGASTSQWITSGDDISYSLGHVGIGTTSPDANLHVTGNAFVSTDLGLGGTLTMGNVLVEALHELSAITATGNVTPHVIEFTNPTTGLVTTGNVGIGTTTPGYTLDVAGGINFTGALTQNGSAYGGGGSGSSPWVISGSDISYIAGDVGIGTSSPQGTLHVSSGTAGDCNLILQADTDNNNEGDNPRIEFWQDGAIQESAIGMTSNRLNFWNSVSSGAGIAFHTGTVNGWTNAIERVTITSTGNVGINQTSPNYTLDVAGDLTCSGTMRHRAFAFYARASGGQIVTSRGILSDSNSTITTEFDYTPAGTASWNGFRSSGGWSNNQGTYFAPVNGIYHVSCKMRLPDSSTAQQEIQWYIKRTNGNEDQWESFEMWISPADGGGRRATMSSTIVKLAKDEGIFPRADNATTSLSSATFGGHFLGTY